MKFNQNVRKPAWSCMIPLAFALTLAACGDGSGPSSSKDSGSSDGGKTEKGPATGRLLDTAVSGVAYAASSGDKGNTDENGTFKYNHGDTIEFKLGALVLGKVKGAAIVTPMELAGDSANKLQNLLILLQSLDVDGNPDNGISIPADAATAVTASINLDSDPAAFAASAELQKAREAGSVAGAVKTAQQANAHFLSQGLSLLSTNIWVKHDDATASIIRISADGTGEYLEGEATPDDSCDANRVCGGNLVSKAGVEYGAAKVSEFDTRGFKFAGKPVIDTNLHAGLSHPRATWRIRTDGSDLITSDIVTVPRERKQASLFGELFHIAGTLEISSSKEPIKTEVKEIRFSKMENDPKGIVGAWAVDTAAIKTPTYFFFSNGKFMVVDPLGDPERPGHTSCGDPGVEFASYSYDAGSGAFSVKSFTYDTNGCAGFSGNDPSSFKLGADGNIATMESKSGTALTLHRISK
ncbi:adhesin [Nitrosovibrio sp. Nv4]|uniref:adhesin n=1 Tax=Nitrosovibrio sp. Nv4 TaxID=1945880 RepID=UPI000BE30E57|nr:adhesin [Nitrosovibrio sp. Nv4]